jgi:hypothetical protein
MTKKAKRPPARGRKAASARPRRTSAKGSIKRLTTKKAQPAPAARARARKAASTKKAGPKRVVRKAPRLERARRTLDDTSGTPSSLDLVRRGTSARTGRAGMAETLRDHEGMSPEITGGDPDVDVEDAYFTGDEAPGGDNPAPDEEVVDDIGRALGVEYRDNEELKAVDKVTERDRKRWELDPASSEDYKDRK